MTSPKEVFGDMVLASRPPADPDDVNNLFLTRKILGPTGGSNFFVSTSF